MLWLEIAIVVAAITLIIISFPKLKSKYQTSSQKTKERVSLYVPMFIAIVVALLLIKIVR